MIKIKCKKCGVIKDSSAYYKSNASECKSCVRKKGSRKREKKKKKKEDPDWVEKRKG